MASRKVVLPVNDTDICFETDFVYKLYDSVSGHHFDVGTELMVVARKHGTWIVGHPTSCELQIVYFKDKIYMPRSKYVLRGTPKILSLNCDENFLAVNYKMNDKSFIDIFSVHPFLSCKDLTILNSICVDCMAKQILWNPMVIDLFGLCLDDGSFTVWSFKAKDQFTLKTIERKIARCVSWSPKGNKIIIALPNGVINQYQMGSGSLKTINSPVNLFDGPYEPIALKWLSTYQFAIIFSANSNDAQPKLFIINTTINECPIYTGFDDVFYSPRVFDVYLIHMPKWNLILTGSKNDNKVNILTTDETTETPLWKQLNFMDKTQTRLPFAVEAHRSYSMLGITTENQANGIPLINTIMTGGSLVSIKMILRKGVPTDVNGNLLGTSCAVVQYHIMHGIIDAKEHRCSQITTEVTIPEKKRFDACNSQMAHQFAANVSESIEIDVKNSEVSDTAPHDDKQLAELRNHVNTVHTETIVAKSEAKVVNPKTVKSHPFLCDVCGNRYKGRCAVKAHIRKNHVNFSLADNKAKGENMPLERQSTNHENQARPMNCVRENNRFANSDELQSPIQIQKIQPKMTDADRKTFTCDICNRQYVRKEAVKKHIYIKHARKYVTTDERKDSYEKKPKIVPKQKDAKSHPILCNICDKRYAKKYAFEMHIRTKHGKNHLESTTMDKGIQSIEEKPNQKTAKSHPFRCNVCGERYKHEGRLSFHQKNDHTTKFSVRKKVMHELGNQADHEMRYKCKKCIYMTNHSGNFCRHRSLCKGKR